MPHRNRPPAHCTLHFQLGWCDRFWRGGVCDRRLLFTASNKESGKELNPYRLIYHLILEWEKGELTLSVAPIQLSQLSSERGNSSSDIYARARLRKRLPAIVNPTAIAPIQLVGSGTGSESNSPFSATLSLPHSKNK